MCCLMMVPIPLTAIHILCCKVDGTSYHCCEHGYRLWNMMPVTMVHLHCQNTDQNVVSRFLELGVQFTTMEPVILLGTLIINKIHDTSAQAATRMIKIKSLLWLDSTISPMGSWPRGLWSSTFCDKQLLIIFKHIYKILLDFLTVYRTLNVRHWIFYKFIALGTQSYFRVAWQI